MYQPAPYKKTDKTQLLNFVQQHPFATVVVQGEHLLATHVPLLTEGTADDFRLFGHIANHNAMRPQLADGVEMLLIFQGAHAYVSSSWYEQPAISTWNYSAVHINTRIKLQTDAELQQSLAKLVATFEQHQKNSVVV